MNIKDVMFFKTWNNEYVRTEKFHGDLFKIFNQNCNESFSSCNSSDIKKLIDRGILIEMSN